ncbi:MAG: Rieske 2Fe-2S domain-containing protein [Pyrinomonadaceae bacterium]|nr:Rieske 2Fe-2S domain-containing protein [Pyrinomonadaceae bacterium]
MDNHANPTLPAESEPDAVPTKDAPATAASGQAEPRVNGSPTQASASTVSPPREAAPASAPPAVTSPTHTSTTTTAQTAVPPATVAAKAPAAASAGVTKAAPKAVPASKPAGAVAVVQSTIDTPTNRTRRRIVWAAIAGFLGTSFLMFLRFFLPRAIYEPSSVFRIGFPGDYSLGVDTKYQQQYRIWVTKTSDRMFVIFARCTHLGCTPDWKSSENKFKCPCHGSGYDSEGVNFEGPAPRPMDRAHVELDAEGQIVVNTGRLYEWPKGGENKFDEPGAYIPL